MVGTSLFVDNPQIKWRWSHLRAKILPVATPGARAAYLDVALTAVATFVEMIYRMSRSPHPGGGGDSAPSAWDGGGVTLAVAPPPPFSSPPRSSGGARRGRMGEEGVCGGVGVRRIWMG